MNPSRASVTKEIYLWNNGIVPYVFESSLSTSNYSFGDLRHFARMSTKQKWGLQMEWTFHDNILFCTRRKNWVRICPGRSTDLTFLPMVRMYAYHVFWDKYGAVCFELETITDVYKSNPEKDFHSYVNSWLSPLFVRPVVNYYPCKWLKLWGL